MKSNRRLLIKSPSKSPSQHSREQQVKVQIPVVAAYGSQTIYIENRGENDVSNVIDHTFELNTTQELLNHSAVS